MDFEVRNLKDEIGWRGFSKVLSEVINMTRRFKFPKGADYLLV